MTHNRSRLLSEARLPYLTDRERQTLAHILEDHGFALPQEND